ncbi:MAG: sterol desaturase family protein [Bdellovibrionales bacterium]|nr:sterol desaturase family protein [Bdellovibrionales bacterium]
MDGSFSELEIRGLFFIIFFFLFAGIEFTFPFRQFIHQRGRRWIQNFAIVFIDTVVVRVTLPFVAIDIALMAQEKHWGLFQLISMPKWFVILASVIFLDFAIYWQHRLFHRIPLLWKLHRMHHSDIMFDVSTALRFHPIEIFLSMLIKISLVIVLGIPAAAVIIFEILLSSSSLFNHMNVNLGKLDSLLRKILVTPNMHRVHHSVVPQETDSNFGFCLSIWDQLFQTKVERPIAEQHDFLIGLYEFRDVTDNKISRLLSQPFL